ncbi:MAG: YdcF family protein [Sphingomicrobium sp.]
MIARFGSLLLLLYALGFILFAVTLSGPAPLTSSRTDAAVVLTGGSGRLERAIEVLRHRKAGRLLVSGADPAVTKADLARRIPRSTKLMHCCVDLDSAPVDTRTNAEETQRWLDRRHYESVRLITSDWHMRRAYYDFRRVLGPDYRIVVDGVPTEPSFLTLFAEYNKYLLRRVAVLLDI